MNWFNKYLLKVIGTGEIPKHVAVIMDGNRRWARRNHLSSVSQGHEEGAKKLKEMIEWFSLIDGIEMLTVYAFSLLNFSRPKDEVQGLMDLAERTFKEMADKPEFFYEKKCKVCFIGKIDMLEERVQIQIRRMIDAGHPNAKFTLNICACYTSHDEIETARDICLENGLVPSYCNVFSNLALPSKPDLMIRTSGVNRLSNFLLLQSENTPIYITDKLWPDLSPFDIAYIFLKYQLRFVLP